MYGMMCTNYSFENRIEWAAESVLAIKHLDKAGVEKKKQKIRYNLQAHEDFSVMCTNYRFENKIECSERNGCLCKGYNFKQTDVGPDSVASSVLEM